MEGHTIITSLHPDGEPKSPKAVKTMVVNQCGCYVRDHIPISFKLWKKSKATDIDADVIPETEKEMLWADVKRHFTFPEDKEQFKDWVMKKMAIAFQMFKKNFNKDYVKKGLTPDFEKDFKKTTSLLGCIGAIQIVRGQRTANSTSQRECEQEKTLPSSWPGRLQGGYSE